MTPDREDKTVSGAFDYSRLAKTAKMPLICVYDHPSDYPNNYVARVWDANRPTRLIVLADTLDEIRAKIPPVMKRLPKAPQDDAVIVEVWM